MDTLEKRLQIARWIAEDVIGIIRPEQKRALDAWRSEKTEHEQEYRELLEAIRNGHELPSDTKDKVEIEWEKFIHRYRRKRRAVRRWLPYAALLVLLLGVAFIFSLKRQGLPEATAGQIRLAEGKVCLILSDGKKVAIEEENAGVLTEKVRARVEVAGRMIDYTAEADQPVVESFNTLIIPKGGEYRIVLSDSSVVWLNAETEFRYPVRFTGDTREVYLKGEACFEVAKNTESPFIVHTSGEMEVKVLGTRFNVNAYAEEPDVVTTLIEGSVEISSGKENLRICPDEQVLFDKHSRMLTCRQVDAGIYAAWKDGQFIFEEQTLEEIIRQLERWYEMEVFYANEEVKRYRFSGNLRKYDNFGKIVKMLEEVSGVKIGIQGKSVVIGTK